MSGIKAPKVVRNCPANWARMHGDDRVRFCTHCDQKVYNLSGMTRDEATEFMAENVGKVCVRFYQRADGTLLTSDCGRAERVRTRVKAATISAFTLLGLAAKFMPTAGDHCEVPTMGKAAVRDETHRVQLQVGEIQAPEQKGS